MLETFDTDSSSDSMQVMDAMPTKETDKVVERDIEKGILVNSSSSKTMFITSDRPHRSVWTITALIVVLSFAVSAAFLAIGLSAAFESQAAYFERSSMDLVHNIQNSLEDYVNAASLIHNRCRSRNFTRTDFRQLYEYLVAGGLDFQAAQFNPNITRDEREAAESEARAFYAEHYPHVQYRGIVAFEFENATQVEPRSQQDFYFPIHYMEPIPGNEPAIDLDYHASGSRRQTGLACMDTGLPALTDRLRLVQETADEGAFGVVLMHPGVNLSNAPDVWPRDLASIVVRIQDLLQRSTTNQAESSQVFIFDMSDSRGEPRFLGGVRVETQEGRNARLSFLPEMVLPDVTGHLEWAKNISAANRIWQVKVVALPGTFEPDVIFVILGGVIICIAGSALALWINTSSRRAAHFSQMQAKAEAEKTALVLENAEQSARAERELNDFIAHEVRNPVAAAMSACSFVKRSIVNDAIADDERETLREDVEIIDNALSFVNDLLRNMLDMHRAANKQLELKLSPVNLLHDVLEPVEGMLYHRRIGKVQVFVECPEDLFVESDHLRLKQVILNLGRNSSKFVDEGFIILRASVIDGSVLLLVEDSGPGIPLDKREKLFSKFQESLDMLSQGTGIGLFLCKSLVDLMEGSIQLDEEYDSGIPGRPGTRFVVDLKKPPLDVDASILESLRLQDGLSEQSLQRHETDYSMDLPEKLSVLLVDDDQILRKLFSRTVKSVAPKWTIRQAANGETALRLTDTESFDLIFMDMYMASVEKQLLGTETVAALRAKGVTCRICGLSANDRELEFLQAGADAFTFKPFPCEEQALTRELCRILYKGCAHGSQQS